MFKKVLIANRGEIAVRIIRTLAKMGIASVAVHSDADRFAKAVQLADEAVRLGPAPAAESYLNIEAVIAACKATGAEAVHPGYGFLSENIGFAERLEQEGIAFIGPTPANIAAFGLKHTARELAEKSGVPLLPGSALLDSAEEALSEAERNRLSRDAEIHCRRRRHRHATLRRSCGTQGRLRQRTAHRQGQFWRCARLSRTFRRQGTPCGGADLRRWQGRVIALGERDCSLQRRNQKVIEETRHRA